MFRIKNGGFTLVELLVTMAILGIITGISLPVLNKFMESNKYTRLEHYSNILESRAKLYVDSYVEDLFTSSSPDCNYITAEMLRRKNMFVDMDDSGLSCNSNNTFIKVSKISGRFYYKVYLGCASKNVLNSEGIIPNGKVTEIYPKKGNKNPYSISDTCVAEDN